MILPYNIKEDLSKKDYYINVRIIIRRSSNQLDDGDLYHQNDIFVSRNATTFESFHYRPILLKEPNFTSSVSIRSRKLKMGTLRISISNMEYEGKSFSDLLSTSSILNKEVDIWFDTQSTYDSSTSLKVFKGNLSRFTHDNTKCTIECDDLYQKIASREIPNTIVTSTANEKYVNKPIPIVYGSLSEAPTVIDGGVVKADSVNLKLVTSGAYEYAGMGVTDGYEGLGVFEGFGDLDAKNKSPLVVYADDYPLPVLMNQHLQPMSDDGQETNQGRWQTQWSESVDVSGQIVIKSLFNIEENVLQVQCIIKPTSVEGINRSWDYDAPSLYTDPYYEQFLNDIAETQPSGTEVGMTGGWEGIDRFSLDYKNSIVDGIIESEDMFSPAQGMDAYNCTLGGDFYWAMNWAGFSDTLVDSGIWFEQWVNVSLAKVQYQYDPPFSIVRHGYWHYLAVNDFVIPRLTNDTSPYDGMRNLFVFPAINEEHVGYNENGAGFRNILIDATLRNHATYISLDNDIAVSLGWAISDPNAPGNVTDSHIDNPHFKDLFHFSDDYWQNHNEYNGYTGGNIPNNWNSINISNYSQSNYLSWEHAEILSQPYVLFSGDSFGVGNISFGILGYNPNTSDAGVYLGNDGFSPSLTISGNLNELTTYFIAEIAESFDKKFYLHVQGRTSVDGGNTPLTNIIDIMRDLAIREMYLDAAQIDTDSNSPGNFSQARNANSNISIAFSVNKTIPVKKLLESLAESTLTFPNFRHDGTLSFPTIRDKYEYSDYASTNTTLIDSKDIIDSSFNLSNIEEVYTAVNIEYKKNYHTNSFAKREEYNFDAFYNISENAMFTYEFAFYGYKDVTSNVLTFQSPYIRNKSVAQEVQKRLFQFHRNQHLEISLTLPLKYINLEIGSLLKFSELIQGVKAYGQDYTKVSNPQWYYSTSGSLSINYGQFFYPLFFITYIRKTSDGIKIKASRLHCLDGGYINLTSWQDAGLIDTSQIYDYGNYGSESGTLPDPPEDIVGCMDPLATQGSYNPDATINDPTQCVYLPEEEEEEEEQETLSNYPDFATYPHLPFHYNFEMFFYTVLPPPFDVETVRHTYNYNWGEIDPVTYQQSLTDSPTAPWTKKFITHKDLYLWVPSFYTDTTGEWIQAEAAHIMNGTTNEDYHVLYDGADKQRMDPGPFVSSVQDESLINFWTEFAHPNNNFNIGSTWMEEPYTYQDADGNTVQGQPLSYFVGQERELTYEQIFKTNMLNYDDWMQYQYWGWSITETDPLGMDFWRNFVGMEIQIQDYRKYNPQWGGANVGMDLIETHIEADLGIEFSVPDTLPDWIMDEFEGKITLALININRLAISIDDVQLGWAIFPGHYDNYSQYMDNFEDFYSDVSGKWVYNDEMDIGWGYIFPGNETWKQFSQAIADNTVEDDYGNSGYELLNIIAGGHSTEFQWMRINLIISGQYGAGLNGLGSLVRQMQRDDHPLGMDPQHVPEVFAISHPDMHKLGEPAFFSPLQSTWDMPFIVYRDDYDDIPVYEDEQVGAGPGDANADSTVNILDIVSIVNFILEGAELAHEGNADFNSDSTINILDIVAMVNLILGN